MDLNKYTVSPVSITIVIIMICFCAHSSTFFVSYSAVENNSITFLQLLFVIKPHHSEYYMKIISYHIFNILTIRCFPERQVVRKMLRYIYFIFLINYFILLTTNIFFLETFF